MWLAEDAVRLLELCKMTPALLTEVRSKDHKPVVSGFMAVTEHTDDPLLMLWRDKL